MFPADAVELLVATGDAAFPGDMLGIATHADGQKTYLYARHEGVVVIERNAKNVFVDIENAQGAFLAVCLYF